MALTEDQKKRLEDLRALKKDWAEADLERADMQELDDLERETAARTLIAKYETEIGKFGVSWTFVASTQGFVVVRLGAAVCYQKLLAAIDASSSQSVGLSDAQDFILANLVSPDRDTYLKWCETLGGLPVVIWPRLAALYRGEREVVAGKL